MFPAKAFEDAIRDEISSAGNDQPMPQRAWEPVVDSLVMVRVVLRIEEEFALDLPDDLMPAGGFDGIDHCVEVFMNTCRELWNTAVPAEEKA